MGQAFVKTWLSLIIATILGKTKGFILRWTILVRTMSQIHPWYPIRATPFTNNLIPRETREQRIPMSTLVLLGQMMILTSMILRRQVMLRAQVRNELINSLIIRISNSKIRQNPSNESFHPNSKKLLILNNKINRIIDKTSKVNLVILVKAILAKQLNQEARQDFQIWKMKKLLQFQIQIHNLHHQLFLKAFRVIWIWKIPNIQIIQISKISFRKPQLTNYKRLRSTPFMKRKTNTLQLFFKAEVKIL